MWEGIYLNMGRLDAKVKVFFNVQPCFQVSNGELAGTQACADYCLSKASWDLPHSFATVCTWENIPTNSNPLTLHILSFIDMNLNNDLIFFINDLISFIQWITWHQWLQPNPFTHLFIQPLPSFIEHLCAYLHTCKPTCHHQALFGRWSLNMICN